MKPYVDFVQRRVVWGDEDDFLALDPQDLIILRELLRSPGVVVSQEQLLSALYRGTINGGPDSAEQLLRVKICKLRHILPWPIVAVYKFGYYVEGYGRAIKVTVFNPSDEFDLFN